MDGSTDRSSAELGSEQTAPSAWIVYDGDCPFCARYVRFVRLRDTIGHVALVDAREGGGLVDEIRAANFNLDDGMVLKWQGRLYHGADCMNMLALMSTPSSAFNRVNRLVFQFPTVARLLYPVLRAGRNLVLRMLGRKKIGPGAGAAL